jgi:hypothetical protein
MKKKTATPGIEQSTSMDAKRMQQVVIAPLPEAYKRRALRVLAMVHELHKAGYQRLRICPGISISGCYWRCAVTSASNILKTHGAMLKNDDGQVALYSSGQDNEYFGWSDAKTDTARELATKFIERFPIIASAGLADDWNYAGWYVRMLGFAERGEFPAAYADWHSNPDPRWLPTTVGFQSGLPMPPGGEA